MLRRFTQQLMLLAVLMMMPIMTFAQQPELISEEVPVETSDSCEDITLAIDGPAELQAKRSVMYSTKLISNASGDVIEINEQLSDVDVTYRLFHQGKLINKSTDNFFKVQFANVGIYEVSATVNTPKCTFVDTITIRSYDDVFFYFGSFLADFNQGLQQNIQQQDTLFSSFIVDEGNENLLDENMLTDLEKKITEIEHSQLFFFNLNNFSHVFTLVDWLQTHKGMNFSTKKVVVISSIDPQLLKKFLAPFIKEYNFDLYVTNMEELRDTFYLLSVGENQKVYEQYDSPIQFVGGTFNYSLSRFVDVLIYYGFSMDVVAILLTIALLVSILVFLRQVVGLGVFGLYFPILMALIFVVTGETITLLFFGLSYLAYRAAKFVQKHITMLVSAKIGTYLLLYILLTVIVLGLVTSIFNYQWNIGGMSDVVLVVSYILMPLIGKKVFVTGKKILSSKHIMNIVRFLFLTYSMSMLLMSVALQHWLLIRPEIIFVFLLLVIIFGRFTGLQLTEYIRFWPLIKKQLLAKEPKKIGMKKK